MDFLSTLINLSLDEPKKIPSPVLKRSMIIDFFERGQINHKKGEAKSVSVFEPSLFQGLWG